jgi:2Fe-2S ferredoxin
MDLPKHQEGSRVVPKVIYLDSAGRACALDATPGESAMSVAVKNGVPGIIGECGGNASCATCHVWVREEFADLVGPPHELEDDLLDLGVADRRPNSRLACQIKLDDTLDGLTLEVPPEQG